MRPITSCRVENAMKLAAMVRCSMRRSKRRKGNATTHSSNQTGLTAPDALASNSIGPETSQEIILCIARLLRLAVSGVVLEDTSEYQELRV